MTINPLKIECSANNFFKLNKFDECNKENCSDLANQAHSKLRSRTITGNDK